MRKRVMLLPCRSASIFVFLSLAFGSIIIFANPPLRGPDEIAHFLRIYSYSRGELLPVMEINARKGIFVSPGLYNQLYFFKTAGEVFARSREEGMRYGQIMAEYSKLADTQGDETEQASMFAPFRYRRLQPGRLYSLYRRSRDWASAQARSSRHAAPHALLRPASFHGGRGLCHRGHSSAEMGVHADRDVAG